MSDPVTTVTVDAKPAEPVSTFVITGVVYDRQPDGRWRFWWGDDPEAWEPCPFGDVMERLSQATTRAQSLAKDRDADAQTIAQLTERLATFEALAVDAKALTDISDPDAADIVATIGIADALAALASPSAKEGA